MLQQIFLAFIGFCSGVIIAGGLVGLLIGLSIVPRYAGITRTGKHIMLYEDVTLMGTLFGTIMFLFHIPLPLGQPFLLLYGLWLWQKWQMYFPFLHGALNSQKDFQKSFFA